MTKYFLQTILDYAKLTNQMDKPFIEVYNAYNNDDNYWDKVYDDYIESRVAGWIDYQGGIL